MFIISYILLYHFKSVHNIKIYSISNIISFRHMIIIYYFKSNTVCNIIRCISEDNYTFRGILFFFRNNSPFKDDDIRIITFNFGCNTI